MARILGIDPGSRITGYGLIDGSAGAVSYVASGAIRTPAGGFPARLKTIFESIAALINTYAPAELAVEQVFVHRNPESALKLGQARGAALCAGVVAGLEVGEYTPRQIKLAVVGSGGAEKEQVQYMVKRLLGLTGTIQADAADALAVALCHANRSRLQGRLRDAEAGLGAP